MENEQSITGADNESSPENSKIMGNVGEKELTKEERKREPEVNFNQLLAVMMEMKSGQEEKLEEIKKGQEEKLEEMKVNIVGVINTKMDVMAEKVEKNEERIGEMKQEIGEIEKKMEREIEKLKKEMKDGLSSRKPGFNREYIREPETNAEQTIIAKPCLKLPTYDGKTSWEIYKTQFTIIAEANSWDTITKARQLAANLRAEAADILRTVPNDQRLNFEALSDTLELRFGEKCLKDYSRLQLKTRQQKHNETLQELATDVERLSHLAFSDCPAEVRETFALQYFVDGIRDTEIQKALRMAELKDLKAALVYSMKFEAAQQASRKERHYSIRGAEVQTNSDPMFEWMSKITKILEGLQNTKQKEETATNTNVQKRNMVCWRCGTEGHIQRSCKARQNQRDKNALGVKEQEN